MNTQYSQSKAAVTAGGSVIHSRNKVGFGEGGSIVERNPLAGLRHPEDNVCPKCGEMEYMARRRGGCAKCRGIVLLEHDDPTCPECMTVFPYDGNRVYCSDECKTTATNRRRRLKEKGRGRSVRIDSEKIRAALGDRRSTLVSKALGHNQGWLNHALLCGSIGDANLPELGELLGCDWKEWLL